jgi:Dolichyl-phosphate-mannose-protein mannosyltransferase
MTETFRKLRGRSLWPLYAILAVQAAYTVPFIFSRAVLDDEALYWWVGHLEWSHWLHGTRIPVTAGYVSGAPVIYPPLAAITGSLTGARILSLCFMLGATTMLWLTATRIYGRSSAIAAAALFAALGVTAHLATYATFDAMALFLLTLAAYFASRAVEAGRWLVLCAAALVLANAAKYASVLWDPVVAGIAALTGWDQWKARLWRGALVAGCWAIGAGVLLLAGGSSYRRGILTTTVARPPHGDPVSAVLFDSFQWVGLVVVLAAVGTVIAFARVSRPGAWLTFLLAVAGLLAPVNQARIHTLTSLHKHVDFGVWFAAMPAGYAVAAILAWLARRLPSYRFVFRAAAVMLTFGVLALGATQAEALSGGVSHSARLIRALRPMIASAHVGAARKILVDTSEVIHVWPPLIPWQDWVNVPRWRLAPDVRILQLIREGQIELAILSFRGKAKTQDYVYLHALQATHAYRLVGVIPFSQGSHGKFMIWQHKT